MSEMKEEWWWRSGQVEGGGAGELVRSGSGNASVMANREIGWVARAGISMDTMVVLSDEEGILQTVGRRRTRTADGDRLGVEEIAELAMVSKGTSSKGRKKLRQSMVVQMTMEASIGGRIGRFRSVAVGLDDDHGRSWVDSAGNGVPARHHDSRGSAGSGGEMRGSDGVSGGQKGRLGWGNGRRGLKWWWSCFGWVDQGRDGGRRSWEGLSAGESEVRWHRGCRHRPEEERKRGKEGGRGEGGVGTHLDVPR